MPITLVRNWWGVALRGIAAVVLGIVMLVWPAVTVDVLVLLFGAYALIDGIANLAALFAGPRDHQRMWALGVEGVAGVIAGLVTFFWPGITALALIYVIAAWAVITGILELIAAFRLRAHVHGEWLLGLAGVASIIFGFILFAVPLVGALVLAVWVGVYVVFFGIIMLALAYRLRSFTRGHLTPHVRPI